MLLRPLIRLGWTETGACRRGPCRVVIVAHVPGRKRVPDRSLWFLNRLAWLSLPCGLELPRAFAGRDGGFGASGTMEIGWVGAWAHWLAHRVKD